MIDYFHPTEHPPLKVASFARRHFDRAAYLHEWYENRFWNGTLDELKEEVLKAANWIARYGSLISEELKSLRLAEDYQYFEHIDWCFERHDELLYTFPEESDESATYYHIGKILEHLKESLTTFEHCLADTIMWIESGELNRTSP